MNAADVTACLVTRGNVDMKPILHSLIFPNVIVYDNSRQTNRRTYGRYLAAREATTPLVYFQDDDVIVSKHAQRELLFRCRPGTLYVNMDPEHRVYPGLSWVGWGAVCHRDLPEKAHDRWRRFYSGRSKWFDLVGCDIAFTMLTPTITFDFGHQNLPYAYGDDRAYALPGYDRHKARLYDQAIKVRSRLENAPAPL